MDCFKNQKVLNCFLLFVLFICVICIFLLRPPAQNTRTCTDRVCKTPQCSVSAALLNASIDPAVNPCDNFYQYACGEWIENHPLTLEAQPPNTIREQIRANREELERFLSQKNNKSEPMAVHQARKLFSLCLDTDAIDQKGIQPIRTIFNQIGVSVNPTNNFDLIAATVRMTKMFGFNTVYEIGVTSDPYNRTVNRIYVGSVIENSQMRMQRFRQKGFPASDTPIPDASEPMSQREYMQLVFNALCEDDTSDDECEWYSSLLSDSDKFTQLTVYLYDLVIVGGKPYPTPDPPKIHSLKYLQDLTNEVTPTSRMPPLNWTQILQLLFEDVENVTLDFSKPEEVHVLFREQFITEMLNFIYSYSLEDHEFAMVWIIADMVAEYAYYPLRNAKAKYRNDITEYPSRSALCTDSVIEVLEVAVSYYYATNEKYINAKKEITEMVTNIRTMFRKRMKSASWMDEVTRKIALKKLDSMKTVITFPHKLTHEEILDQYYEDWEVTDDYLYSILMLKEQQELKELSSLNAINDRENFDFFETMTMVNAFYYLRRNAIIIPAAISRLTLYGHGLKALNYGSLGYIIGHEITHGFDNDGMRFNYLGDPEKWCRNETLTGFMNRASCFQNAYQSYYQKLGDERAMIHAKRSLGENIADNGGFKNALLAYKQYVLKNGEEPKLLGFDSLTHEQLFTIGFANIFCENSYTSELGDEHSPNPMRVNGIAINSDEFSRIWNCSKGTNMNPNRKRCKLW